VVARQSSCRLLYVKIYNLLSKPYRSFNKLCIINSFPTVIRSGITGCIFVSREKSRSVIGGGRRFENPHVSGNVVLRVSDFGYCGDCENRWTWFKC